MPAGARRQKQFADDRRRSFHLRSTNGVQGKRHYASTGSRIDMNELIGALRKRHRIGRSLRGDVDDAHIRLALASAEKRMVPADGDDRKDGVQRLDRNDEGLRREQFAVSIELEDREFAIAPDKRDEVVAGRRRPYIPGLFHADPSLCKDPLRTAVDDTHHRSGIASVARALCPSDCQNDRRARPAVFVDRNHLQIFVVEGAGPVRDHES
jgi:hypothetical protein